MLQNVTCYKMSVYKNFNVISKSVLKHEILKKVQYGTTLSRGWITKSVIPDVLDEIPKRKLAVQYPDLNINEGNLVKPVQVKTKPEISWKPDPGAFYTVCMTDPDAPSRKNPDMREWLHWLMVNIPENKEEKGEVLAEYIGAGPPKDTGLHRYVFVLYKQPNKITFSEKKLTNTSPKDRPKFSIRKFAQKYGLGQPLAGNFFEAGYDDYVPELYKQLGVH